MVRPCKQVSHPLDDGRDAHPAAHAQRREAVAQVAALQLVDQRAEDAEDRAAAEPAAEPAAVPAVVPEELGEPSTNGYGGDPDTLSPPLALRASTHNGAADGATAETARRSPAPP